MKGEYAWQPIMASMRLWCRHGHKHAWRRGGRKICWGKYKRSIEYMGQSGIKISFHQFKFYWRLTLGCSHKSIWAWLWAKYTLVFVIVVGCNESRNCSFNWVYVSGASLLLSTWFLGFVMLLSITFFKELQLTAANTMMMRQVWACRLVVPVWVRIVLRIMTWIAYPL